VPRRPHVFLANVTIGLMVVETLLYNFAMQSQGVVVGLENLAGKDRCRQVVNEPLPVFIDEKGVRVSVALLLKVCSSIIGDLLFHRCFSRGVQDNAGPNSPLLRIVSVYRGGTINDLVSDM